MKKLSFICLCLLILCALFYCAHCEERKDYEKKWKKHKDRLYENELSNEKNDIADENEPKSQWYEKLERKIQRLSSQLEAAKGKKIGAIRQERDVTRMVAVPRREDVLRDIPDPPAHEKVAQVARFIVHNSAWASGSYINHHPGQDGLPMATLFSVSDGYKNASTGTPYMYITPKSIAVQDLAKDNRLSLLMSLAETDYCQNKGFDPEDPRCAYVILTGTIKEIKNGSFEWNFARNVYLDRHPGMSDVPAGHKFRFVKFKIRAIAIQDYFGGVKFPSVDDYYNARINETTGETLSWT